MAFSPSSSSMPSLAPAPSKRSHLAPKESLLMPLMHHAMSGIVIGFAAPTRLTRVSPRVALGARLVWMAWSAVSHRDLQIMRREKLVSLLEDSTRNRLMKKFDTTLLQTRWGGSLKVVDGQEKRYMTTVDATVEDWSQREGMNRRTLMLARMSKNFSEVAQEHYTERIERYHNMHAILMKAGLAGITFGILPTVVEWGMPFFDGRRGLDVALFGRTPSKVATHMSDKETSAVLNGLEDLAWFDDSNVTNDPNDKDLLQIFNRKGKVPLLQTHF